MDPIDWSVVWLIRFKDIAKNPSDYDVWFDYLRLMESEKNSEQIREVYERAIANIPPSTVNNSKTSCNWNYTRQIERSWWGGGGSGGQPSACSQHPTQLATDESVSITLLFLLETLMWNTAFSLLKPTHIRRPYISPFTTNFETHAIIIIIIIVYLSWFVKFVVVVKYRNCLQFEPVEKCFVLIVKQLNFVLIEWQQITGAKK